MITWLGSMSGLLALGLDGRLVALRAGGDGVERLLGGDDRRRADEVGDADARDGLHRDAAQVAEGERDLLLAVGEDDEHRAAEEVAEQLGGLLRGRRVEAGRVQDGDRAALGVDRERAAQRGAALLAVDLEGVVARRRAEDGAAAGPDRVARRAGAGTAGALLAPRLGAAAADEAAGLGRVRALPARVELRADRLVHERTVEARAESGLVELDLLGAAEDGSVSHRSVPPRRRCAGRARSRGPAAGSAWRRPGRPRGPSG